MRLIGPFILFNVEFVCNYRAVLNITVGSARKLKYLSFGWTDPTDPAPDPDPDPQLILDSIPASSGVAESEGGWFGDYTWKTIQYNTHVHSNKHASIAILAKYLYRILYAWSLCENWLWYMVHLVPEHSCPDGISRQWCISTVSEP
jgi:hypothetical protein